MVSIIVTHKQCLRYLEECLNSIAEQEFQDYETVLVVDDLQDEPEEFQKVIEKDRRFCGQKFRHGQGTGRIYLFSG